MSYFIASLPGYMSSLHVGNEYGVQSVTVEPFTHGDTAGKTEAAVADAKEQMAKLPEGGIRSKLYELQALVGTEFQQVECPLQHLFAPGVYVRTIFIPAGTVIVGKIHKHRHANILSKGLVTVTTEAGGRETLEGPIQMISEPGTKRALFAHTDLVWTTIHPTELTDLAEIEDHVIAKSYEEYEAFVAKQLEVKP
jgi:hypothetical protein